MITPGPHGHSRTMSPLRAGEPVPVRPCAQRLGVGTWTYVVTAALSATVAGRPPRFHKVEATGGSEALTGGHRRSS